MLEAIKKAKENHVVVELTKDVNYKTANEAKADIENQVKSINALTELVTNANERLTKVIEEASKSGVKLDKEIKLTLTLVKKMNLRKKLNKLKRI